MSQGNSPLRVDLGCARRDFFARKLAHHVDHHFFFVNSCVAMGHSFAHEARGMCAATLHGGWRDLDYTKGSGGRQTARAQGALAGRHLTVRRRCAYSLLLSATGARKPLLFPSHSGASSHAHGFPRPHPDAPVRQGPRRGDPGRVRRRSGAILVPGIEVETSRLAVELAARYPGRIFAAVGMHPHDATDVHSRCAYHPARTGESARRRRHRRDRPGLLSRPLATRDAARGARSRR